MRIFAKRFWSALRFFTLVLLFAVLAVYFTSVEKNAKLHDVAALFLFGTLCFCTLSATLFSSSEDV